MSSPHEIARSAHNSAGTSASSGYVLFRLGEHTFATPLDAVREIVRLSGVERLPGTTAPLAGVLVVRGMPLPVWDVRRQDPGVTPAGDCLVVEVDGDSLGVAVDEVIAVLQPDELGEAEAAGRALPSYVTAVRRHGEVPVLMVDLHLLLDAA
jgi:chemotaxis signal transduction protein